MIGGSVIRIVFASILFLALPVRPAEQGASLNAADFQPLLREAISNLLELPAVSVEARHTYCIFRKVGPPTLVTGTFSFIASGPMYRSRFEDSGGGKHSISLLEVAFDGEKFVSYRDDGKYMTQSGQDQKSDPTAPMNPLYAHFQFLSPLSDACPGCVLRLNYLREIMSKDGDL